MTPTQLSKEDLETVLRSSIVKFLNQIENSIEINKY